MEERDEARKENRTCWGRGRGQLAFSVTQKLRPAGGEGASRVDMWGGGSQAAGSEGSGPGAGAGQVDQLRHKEGRVSKGESGEGAGWGCG